MLRQIESAGKWPQDLFDAFIAVISVIVRRLDSALCASFLWFTGCGPRFALLKSRTGFTRGSLTLCTVQAMGILC